MRGSILTRWLPTGPAAVTMVALGFGVTAEAAKPAAKQPNLYPIALLSDTDADQRSQVNTDPGVMGEVELVRERYSDGSIHIERQTTLDRDGNYVNHGSWKMFDQGGDILAEGHYHFGRRVGLWTRWHGKKDGNMFSDAAFREFKAPFMSQVNFTDGEMDGDWIITDANDRKMSQISLKEGKRHGMAITWLPNGTTYRQATYENGMPVGDMLELNTKTGKVERVATFADGRQIINKISHYPNTRQEKQKKSEVLYLGPEATQASADDFWNARLAKFDTEGQNMRHGLARAWFPNGKLESEGTYQHGKKSGTFTFWHENGQVASTGEYLDDKAEGQWVWWHENGQRSAYGRYEDGQLTGEWRWWNEGGKLTKQHVYDGTESAMSETDQPTDAESAYAEPEETMDTESGFAEPEEALDISSRSLDATR
jgi:antitoxin component YwqK of YwqJK toxin-antitoxin module